MKAVWNSLDEWLEYDRQRNIYIQELLDKVESHRIQAEVYYNDFADERQEKKMYQMKNADLEREKEILKKMLEPFQQNEMERLHKKRQAALSRYEADFCSCIEDMRSDEGEGYDVVDK